MLQPNRGVSYRGQGLGVEQSQIRAPLFWEVVHRGSARIRACGQAPIRWHRSRGAPLPRKDDRTRWIHLFDPI
eukprot:2511895-Pyramimonas_sp.AAC.1